MLRQGLAGMVMAALVVGCGTSARFSPAIDEVAAAARAVDTKIAEAVAPDLAAARRAQTRDAALGRDLWVLSPDCLALAEASANPALSGCRIDKTRFGDRSAAPNLAEDVTRKSKALSDYVTALDVLANATSEEELFASIAVARIAFKDIGGRSGAEDLARFVSGLGDSSERIEAVGRAAFDALRYRKLREVVTEADPALAEVVSDIQIGLLALGKDPGFLARSLALQQANANAQLLRGQDEAAVAAYRALETAHAAFVETYDDTLVGQVGRVAQAHRGLAAAMADPEDPERIAGYLEALRGLARQVRE